MTQAEALSRAESLLVAPERHIPVQLSDIHQVVRTRVDPTQREQFDRATHLIESLCLQQFGAFRRNLKQSLGNFSAGAQGRALHGRVGRALPRKEEMDVQEERVLSDLMQLMVAARFRVMTDEEWQTAMLEDFMFSLPVEVNFSVFDTQMLPRFWAGNDERRRLRQVLPDMADRILVFHRGVAVATASGMYFNEKIDLLVNSLILQPLAKALRALRPPRKTATSLDDAMPLLAVAGTSTQGEPEEMEAAAAARVAACSPGHRHQKKVERRTLARLLPTPMDVLMNLFRTIHLQEPTWQEVVIVYRTAEPTNEVSLDSAPNSAPDEERLRTIMAHRNIHVRSFHNVPMADAEIIFPEKRVYIKPASLVQLVVTVVTAIATAVITLWQAHERADWRLVVGALSVVLARCMQVHTALQGERSAIQQEMLHVQYNAANDSHEGVIGMVVEDLADQQTKEMIIAYALLLQRAHQAAARPLPVAAPRPAHTVFSGAATAVQGTLNLPQIAVAPSASGGEAVSSSSGLTQLALDLEAEDWLEAVFNLRADFASEDALARLLEWGLVHKLGGTTGDGSARHVAVPLEEALRRLSDFWAATPGVSTPMDGDGGGGNPKHQLIDAYFPPRQPRGVTEQIRALPVSLLLGPGAVLPAEGSIAPDLRILSLRPLKARQYSMSRRGPGAAPLSQWEAAAAAGNAESEMVTRPSGEVMARSGSGQRSLLGRAKKLAAQLGLRELLGMGKKAQ